MKNRKSIIILAIFGFALGVFIYHCAIIIFQEGNPWPQIKGIVELNFTGKKLVRLSESGEKYLSRSKNGQEIIEIFLKNSGYNFVEQMGSGYFFESENGDRLIVTRRLYSRFYSIWNLSQKKDLEESIKSKTILIQP